MNKSSMSSATWASADSMLRAAEQESLVEEARLQKLLDRSDQVLYPFRDPLRANVGTNRWLAKEREEAYSDWLAWILEQVSVGDVLRLLRIENPELLQRCSSQKCRVKREWPIPPDGRLDLHISFGDELLIIVEVKKTVAKAAEVDKQKGYCKWLETQSDYGQVRAIFLAIGDSDEQYLKGFEARQWEHLSIELRRMLPRLKDSLEHVTTAMFVAFIAAVERNLLKLVPTGQDECYGKLLYARTADHVEQSLTDKGVGHE